MTDITPGLKLYKIDNKGKLRVWWMEQEGAKHRTVAGLDDGALTYSEWTVCIGKQKRSDEEQAAFEIKSGYDYNLKRTYHLTPEGAAGGAHFFEPQLAESWKDTTWAKWIEKMTKGGWTPRFEGHTGAYFQPKLDGFCCIAQASGLTSREGEPIIAVPHVMEALAAEFEKDPDAIFHGELYNHDLKDEFERLSSILKKQKNITPEQFALAREMAQFHIYDYAAPHIRDLGFGDRYAELETTIWDSVQASGGVLHLVETVPIRDEPHMLELFHEAVEKGYEGGIGRLDMRYEKKRCWWVLKIKIFDDGEFEVDEIVEGKGNYTGYAKRVTCRLPDGRTFGAGIKGGKKPEYTMEAMLAGNHKVVTIRHFGWTADGIPRMGVATKWHGEARTL